MKKMIFVQLISLVFSFSAVPAVAKQYAKSRPCESRAKRMLGGGVGGALIGALVGAIANPDNGQGAWRGAAAMGGIGAASGIPNQPGCVPQPKRERRNESQRYNQPYPNRITPAGERQKDDSADMPSVFIRRLNGGDQDVLIGLLGPAMDKNGYSMVDRNQGYGERNENVVDYVVDVTLQQITQSYGNGNVSYYGNGWGFNSSPNSGKAQFLVNVTTYHNGRYARELSATGLPETVTLSGGNVNVRVKGFNMGSNGETYAVDPYTMAAYQAIAKIFNLR